MALGRGLDALFGEMKEAYDNESTFHSSKDIVEIDLEKIQVNPFQPRKFFDEKSLKELADSIIANGLLQPIIVHPVSDSYIIIAGERRYRASKLANLQKIKAIVSKSNEIEIRELALIENIQRDALSSIELAQAYQELIKNYKITHEMLAKKIHKSRTHITNTLRLLQLLPETQLALLEKKISTGHAKVLIGIDKKNELDIVSKIIEEKLNVRETEKIVKNLKLDQNSIDKINTNHFNFFEIEKKFQELGFQIKVSHNILSIKFKNKLQIDDLLEKISKNS